MFAHPRASSRFLWYKKDSQCYPLHGSCCVISDITNPYQLVSSFVMYLALGKSLLIIGATERIDGISQSVERVKRSQCFKRNDVSNRWWQPVPKKAKAKILPSSPEITGLLFHTTDNFQILNMPFAIGSIRFACQIEHKVLYDKIMSPAAVNVKWRHHYCDRGGCEVDPSSCL